MDMHKLKEQVDTIRQAFGYVNRFKGRTFVIKIDSSLIAGPFFPVLIRDVVLLHSAGIRIVIVPGAKTRISEILRTFKIRCRTVAGIRISPPRAMPFIKMAAFDVSNKVMTLLAENETNAIIGNWVRARAIGIRNGIDYQSSGIVDAVRKDILEKVLAEGMMPILPNIGWSARGKPYNISSDHLATAIGRSLEASKLFFLTDLGGIPGKGLDLPEEVPVTDDGIITQLTVPQAGALLDRAAGVPRSRANELISLGYEACTGGVERVHVADGRIEGVLLKEVFSNRGFGTMIYSNQHEFIRPMTHLDIPGVLPIMEGSAEEDTLVQRTARDVAEKIADYVVYEVDGTIHGCAALHSLSRGAAELAALAVDEVYARLGTGRKIVSYLIEKATKAKLRKVFVLTTQTTDWFERLGFVRGKLRDLPAARRASLDPKRNSQILSYAISTERRRGRLASE